MPIRTTKEFRGHKRLATDPIHSSTGNVFADLNLPHADERLAKAELAHEICSLITAAKLSQAQAAKRLGIDQPKVSALMSGRLKDFSTERLLRFLIALGRDVLITTRTPKRSRPAALHVLAET